MAIYIFLSSGHEGHLTLDNGKHVNDKETINLDKEDLERPIIKEMIKEKSKNKDRLILCKKPKSSNI